MGEVKLSQYKVRKMIDKTENLVSKINNILDLNFVRDTDLNLSYALKYKAKKKGIEVSLSFRCEKDKIKATLLTGTHLDRSNFYHKSVCFSFTKDNSIIAKNDLLNRLGLLDIDNIIDNILRERQKKEEEERIQKYKIAVLNHYFDFKQGWSNNYYARCKGLDITISESLRKISIVADEDLIVKICTFLKSDIDKK